ncbi:hypothetical protein PENANT_c001G08044 [Penicillium antarcticum]|uniref:BHLH domain-containing protein n=1 Tax=Penicillium antarcticum TaxID=416450 RepID=A0A1V6QN60_9EURO|nr:uncharacterized protein N7508_010445 [Penicillium antarcticum]KAJ5295624.1 hypothetical protein N7508_010445 [Penicillium antarcticum]OQD90417.1 hypothetical protein PENANT_c001G08044 [Penicillium antarcticum]
MSDFDRHAVSASVDNDFADMLQFYTQMPDHNLSIADVFQGHLDVDSASSTPTGLPSTPVFWGNDSSLNTQSKPSNDMVNDFMDFRWNETDGCPDLWNSINEDFSFMPASMQNGDSWYLPSENSKDSQTTPMAPMHTFHSPRAHITASASPLSQVSVEPTHHSIPQGLPASSNPTAPYTHNSTATAEVAPKAAPSSSISTTTPPLDLAPTPHRSSPASPCPASPSPKGAIARKNSTTMWKRRNWHPLATPELRPKISPVIPSLNQQNVTPPDLSAHNLATKSNYQHIQDGTLPPGVKYPSKVTRDNLNQRRTYHRLAERNRRDRFNAAIKEMEALIPAEFVEERNKSLGLALNAISASPTATGTSAKKEKEKAPSAEQTKADVMEIAADYIKMLTASLAEKNERMSRLAVPGDVYV